MTFGSLVPLPSPAIPTCVSVLFPRRRVPALENAHQVALVRLRRQISIIYRAHGSCRQYRRSFCTSSYCSCMFSTLCPIRQLFYRRCSFADAVKRHSWARMIPPRDDYFAQLSGASRAGDPRSKPSLVFHVTDWRLPPGITLIPTLPDTSRTSCHV